MSFLLSLNHRKRKYYLKRTMNRVAEMGRSKTGGQKMVSFLLFAKRRRRRRESKTRIRKTAGKELEKKSFDKKRRED